MKGTDDLIAMLAHGAGPTSPPVGVLLLRMLLPAVALAAILMAVGLGVRDDIAAVLNSVDVQFKFLVMGMLATIAGVLLLSEARPHVIGHRTGLLLLPVVVLVAGVVVEWLRVPVSERADLFWGEHPEICLISIPILALAPLAAAILALRHGAPAEPVRAGAVAGVLAGGLAATLYAAHCTDDSPLFVGTWYTIAVLFTVALGAWAGHRFARW